MCFLELPMTPVTQLCYLRLLGLSSFSGDPWSPMFLGLKPCCQHVIPRWQLFSRPRPCSMAFSLAMPAMASSKHTLVLCPGSPGFSGSGYHHLPADNPKVTENTVRLQPVCIVLFPHVSNLNPSLHPSSPLLWYKSLGVTVTGWFTQKNILYLPSWRYLLLCTMSDILAKMKVYVISHWFKPFIKQLHSL